LFSYLLSDQSSARIDISIEPAKPKDFLRIYADQPPERPVTGMVQISAFLPYIASDIVTPGRDQLWREYRDGLNNAGLSAGYHHIYPRIRHTRISVRADDASACSGCGSGLCAG
jgi:hypothetical protein